MIRASLRPIGAVNNAGNEKVDWLVCRILSQLIQYVSANIKNAGDRINEIESLRTLVTSVARNSKCFISLNAAQLYHSILIDFGIDTILEFAEAH